MKKSNLIKLSVEIVVFIAIYIAIFLDNYSEASLYSFTLFILYCLIGFMIGSLIRKMLVKRKKYKILNHDSFWLIIVIVIVMEDIFNSNFFLKGVQIILLSTIVFISYKKSLSINA